MNEIKRIQIHLEYVIKKLQNTNTTNLTRQQLLARANIIKELKDYCTAQKFPKHNIKSTGWKRLPRFIDNTGTFCAVGHLMKVTGYQELAKEINQEYEYSYVEDIKNPKMIHWAEKNGLTVKECAMIQPTYGFCHNCDFYDALLHSMGASLTMLIIPIILLLREKKYSPFLKYALIFTILHFLFTILHFLFSIQNKAGFDQPVPTGVIPMFVPSLVMFVISIIIYTFLRIRFPNSKWGYKYLIIFFILFSCVEFLSLYIANGGWRIIAEKITCGFSLPNFGSTVENSINLILVICCTTCLFLSFKAKKEIRKKIKDTNEHKKLISRAKRYKWVTISLFLLLIIAQLTQLEIMANLPQDVLTYPFSQPSIYPSDQAVDEFCKYSEENCYFSFTHKICRIK